jgi:hypothetical protein
MKSDTVSFYLFRSLFKDARIIYRSGLQHAWVESSRPTARHTRSDERKPESFPTVIANSAVTWPEAGSAAPRCGSLPGKETYAFTSLNSTPVNSNSVSGAWCFKAGSLSHTSLFFIVNYFFLGSFLNLHVLFFFSIKKEGPPELVIDGRYQG